MRLIRFICIFLFLIFICFCSPTQLVKPLQKGQRAAAITYGGPLIKFAGAPIPIPFTTLGFSYGLTSKITGYASLHTTSLIFGNLQTTVGGLFSLYEQENKFGLTVSPAIQTAYNIRNKTGFRIWPTLDLNAYYHPLQKPSFVYIGANSWFELSSLRAHNEPQANHIIPNIHAGYMLVKTKWQHQFEIKYLGLGIPNLPGVVDYIGISHKGALGIYYSLIRKF
ncbi:MAG: hypothetical protein JWO32_1882 [Bacteroidetes bacterium]|nr:hypothetical protein [Bacteroidota bacterium]